MASVFDNIPSGTNESREYLVALESHLLKLFCLYIAILFIGVVPQLNPTNLAQGDWFQRAGSLLCVLSIYCEINLSQFKYGLSKIYNTEKSRYETYNIIMIKRSDFSKSSIGLRLSRGVKLIEIITHSSLVVGTLIWGYGDQLYFYLTS